MCSKILTLALALFTLSACSLRTNEEVKKNEVAVNPMQAGCLSQAAPVMSGFFQGEATEPELNAFFTCTEAALVSFTSNTQGRESEIYTGEELAAFLSKYFMNGKIVPPALVEQAMALKQGMLGGDSKKVSKKELTQTIALLRAFKLAAFRVRPYMPLSVQSFKDRGYTADQFETAMATFQTSFKEVSALLASSQGTYTFDQLTVLLRELKPFFYPDAQEKTWIDSALNHVQILRPAKSIFVSPPKDKINKEDWAKFYELAPLYYGLYLRAGFYFQNNLEFYTHGSGLSSLESLFQDFTSLVKLALSHQPNGTIRSEEVNELLVALHQNNMLPMGVETAQSILRTIFTRFLKPLNSQASYIINEENLQRLSQTFYFSTEGLRALEKIFQEKKTLTRQEILALPEKELLAATALKNKLSQQAILAIKDQARAVKTVFPEASSIISIPDGPAEDKLHHSSMVKIHLFYSLNRLLVQGYGAKVNFLSRDEIEVLVGDIFPILENLSLVGEEARASVTKRLFEGSLFLYGSDGDAGLTMHEALELESLLISTIIKGSKIHNELAALCQAQNKDNRGRFTINEQCFTSRFLARYKDYWSQLPGFVRFMDKAGPVFQAVYFGQMAKVARKNRIGEDFTQTDTQAMILLPYYIDMLFSRFDQNRDGLLTNEEAETAYPVFQPFIAKKSMEYDLTEPETHHAVYMFLLAYQELPSDMKLTWLWRRYITGDKDFAVNRGQVIQIFEKLLAPKQ